MTGHRSTPCRLRRPSCWSTPGRFDHGAADSGGRRPLTAAGRASRIAAPSGQALLLDGTAHTTAPDAVFRTDLDFSVTAWVKLDAIDSWGTVLSVHHGDFDVFLLSYDSDKGRWAALVPNQATG
ncbi:LamG-like jellyroll fold domain-containing protein [Spirillospora sp. CA-108201]